MSDAVAVFDLDGTITRSDTYLAFLVHTLRRRPRRAVHAGAIAYALARFRAGRITRGQLKAVFLKAVVGGCTRAEVDALVEGFMPRVTARMVKPAAVDRIEWHRARGHRLVLASASVDLYVTHVGAHLRFDTTISTRAFWKDDRLTGALNGDNLLGDAKLEAVKGLLAGADPKPTVYAYSDHHADLPLLRFADVASAIDPTPKLRAAAPAAGIKIETWR